MIKKKLFLVLFGIVLCMIPMNELFARTVDDHEVGIHFSNEFKPTTTTSDDYEIPQAGELVFNEENDIIYPNTGIKSSSFLFKIGFSLLLIVTVILKNRYIRKNNRIKKYKI